MLHGMVRMDLTRRLNANRALSATMSFLALIGWGAFAYAAGSAAAQDQLRAEREQQQAAVGDLAQIQAKLASARDEL